MLTLVATRVQPGGRRWWRRDPLRLAGIEPNQTSDGQAVLCLISFTRQAEIRQVGRHREKQVGHCIALSANRWLHYLVVGVAIVGSFFATEQAFAAVSPTEYSPSNSTPYHSAAVDKLLADAQRALNSGKIQQALYILKIAVNTAPQNSAARVQLGKLLLQTGDEQGAERELRQARIDGAPDALVLPPLLQAMLSRNENQELLDLFPDPASNSSGPTAPDILKARALALQKLGRAQEAVDAMDRSLKLRRDVPGLLTGARLSLQQGDFGAASRFVDESVQKWPDDPDAMLFKAEMLLASQDNSAALNLANQLSSKFPTNLSGQFVSVEAYLRLNQDAKAKAEIDNILAQNPGNFLATFYKALLMARAENSKGAWGLAQGLPAEFLDVDQGIATVVAQMAQNAGAVDTSISMLTSMLKKHPDQLGVRVRLAAIHLQQNSIASALETLRLVQDSTDPRVVRLLAIIYMRTHRPDDALDALGRLDVAGSKNADVKRSIALLELQMGRPDTAVALARSFQSSHPGTDADLLMADVLLRTKHADQAAALLSKSISNHPNRSVLLRLVWFEILSNHRKRADDLMSKWLASNPDDEGVRLEYATFLQQLDDDTKAISQYEMILKQDPNNAAALNDLGWLIQRSDPTRAYTLLTRAWNLSPNSANVADTLGWLKFQQKDVAGALGLLTRAHALRPDDGEITYHLVIALDANAKRDAARITLKSLLASGTKFKERPAAVKLSSLWH
jgi:Tfp pilus assembly protein PilF